MSLPDYLEDDDFNPNSLNKSELSSILASHGFLIPTSTKKGDLVKSFQENILDRRAEIVKQRNNVQANNSGFIRTRTMTTPSPSVKASVKKTKTKEEKADKSKLRDKSLLREADKEEIFSDENPFQSDVDETPSLKKRGRPRSTKKKIEVEPVVEIIVDNDSKLRGTLRKKISMSKKSRSLSRSISPSERKASSRLTSPVRTTNDLHSPSHSKAPKFAPIGVLDGDVNFQTFKMKKKSIVNLAQISRISSYIILGVILCWFIFVRWIYHFPLCLQDREFGIRNVTLNIFESCMPCPLHGTCEKGILKCEKAYHAVTPSWFSPLISCLPDRKQQMVVEKLALMIQKELQSVAGKYECGSVTSPWLSEENLKEFLAKRLPQKQIDKKFEDYFIATVNKITSNGKDYHLKHRTHKDHLQFISLRPSLSFSCSAKIFLQKFWEDYYLYLIGSAGGVVIIVFVLWQQQQMKQRREFITGITEHIIGLLVEQERRHRTNPSIPSFVSCSQLRDTICPPEYRFLWQSVSIEVVKNTNIRESVTSIKGDQHRVWEWVGADVLTSPRK